MSAENASRFDIDVAFPCDIDLEWFLVPKAWIRQIVNTFLVKRLLSVIERFRNEQATN